MDDRKVTLVVDGVEFQDIPLELFAVVKDESPLMVAAECHRSKKKKSAAGVDRLTLTPGRAPGAFKSVLDVLHAMASEPSKRPYTLIVLDDETQREELEFYHVMPGEELSKMVTKKQALQLMLQAEELVREIFVTLLDLQAPQVAMSTQAVQLVQQGQRDQAALVQVVQAHPVELAGLAALAALTEATLATAYATASATSAGVQAVHLRLTAAVAQVRPVSLVKALHTLQALHELARQAPAAVAEARDMVAAAVAEAGALAAAQAP